MDGSLLHFLSSTTFVSLSSPLLCESLLQISNKIFDVSSSLSLSLSHTHTHTHTHAYIHTQSGVLLKHTITCWQARTMTHSPTSMHTHARTHAHCLSLFHFLCFLPLLPPSPSLPQSSYPFIPDLLLPLLGKSNIYDDLVNKSNQIFVIFQGFGEKVKENLSKNDNLLCFLFSFFLFELQRKDCRCFETRRIFARI